VVFFLSFVKCQMRLTGLHVRIEGVCSDFTINWFCTTHSLVRTVWRLIVAGDYISCIRKFSEEKHVCVCYVCILSALYSYFWSTGFKFRHVKYPDCLIQMFWGCSGHFPHNVNISTLEISIGRTLGIIQIQWNCFLCSLNPHLQQHSSSWTVWQLKVGLIDFLKCR